MHKIEGLVKCPIVNLRHIKIFSCHMVSICYKHSMPRQQGKCVHIYNQIMIYHIGNVCGIFVRNVHGLIFQVQNKIRKIQMLAPPYVFVSVNKLHVVLLIKDALLMKINSVNCVRLLHMKLFLHNCILEKSLSQWSHQ